MLVIFAAYSAALAAPFVYDDLPSIPENVSIRHLWPPADAFRPPSGSIAVSGRPVVNYSLALNYALNRWLGVDQRPDPDGPHKTVAYHIVNLLLHLACGFLLFGIIRRTLRLPRFAAEWAAAADPTAAVVAGLWLLHPIQTEAVDYLVQRTELLVSFFYLGTLYGAIRSWEAKASRRAAVWAASAIALCLLGMGSKEVILSAPLMVILYDRAFRFSSWREVFRAPRARPWFYAALAATGAWAIVLIAGGSRLRSTVGFHLGMSWYQYLYSQGWAIPHYMRLVLWPDRLTLDYGQDPIRGLRGLPGLVLLSAMGVATIIAWLRASKWGWLGFLGAWFFLILAPSSSFAPIRTEIAAERRIYLALAAVLTVVVIGGETVRRRLPTRVTRRALWVLAPLGLLLFVATFARSRTFADPEALWRGVVRNAPLNPRGYDNLAAVLRQQHPPRSAEAESLLRRATALDSTYLNAWNTLATIAIERGHPDEARALLERSLAIDSLYVEGGEQLGNLLVRQGEPGRAIPILERIAAHFPNDECYVALATAYMALGRGDDATKALRRAIDLNPARADALRFLGAALIAQGRGAEAVPYLETAVQSDPGSGQAFAMLSVAYAASGRAQDALQAARTATARGPADANVYLFTGRAMVIVGNRDEAIQLFRRALELQPGYPPARQALADLGVRPD